MESKLKFLGYNLFFLSRGPFLTAIVIILIPLILDLLKYNVNSEGKVDLFFFSFVPSSLITIINSLSCLCVVILSPLIGVISDHGESRHNIIKIIICVFVFSIALSMTLLVRFFWWLGFFVQLLIITSFECCHVLFTSYLSEISKNKQSRSLLSTLSVFSENLAVVFYLLSMPILLRNEKPRNLISKGNFEVQNSFGSWDLQGLDAKLPCYASFGEFQQHFGDIKEAGCYQALDADKRAYLEIFLPEKSTIRLEQTKEIHQNLYSHFLFSTVLSTQKEDETAEVNLIISQREQNNENILNQKISQTFSIDSEEKFFQTKFNTQNSIKFLTFIISITSLAGHSATVKVHNIETVLSINSLHVFILFFSGIWFVLLASLAALLLRKRNTEPAEELNLTPINFFRMGFSMVINSLKQCFRHTHYLQFILGNSFWTFGFTVFNTSVLIYLEDKFALSSSELARTFFCICVSAMFGAWLNFYLGSRIGQWDTALYFLGLWVFNPILLHFINPKSVFLMTLLPLYIGTCFGAVASLKYAIFSNLIPEKREGEYMGLLYFSTKLMEFFANLFITIFSGRVKAPRIIGVASLFFLVAFLIFLPFMLDSKRQENLVAVETNEEKVEALGTTN